MTKKIVDPCVSFDIIQGHNKTIKGKNMEKLQKIQQELVARKTEYNDFGKYSYRNLESMLAAIKPMLDGALLSITDELVYVGDRYYIKATATFKDGDFVQSATAYAREELSLKGMSQGQITGATSSYARKYAVQALFLIDNEEDLDAVSKETKDEPMTEAQEKLLNNLKVSWANIFKRLGVTDKSEITKTQAANLIEIKLKQKKAGQEDLENTANGLLTNEIEPGFDLD